MRALRELLSFGRNMVGVNLSLLVYSYVDIAVIGRFLGPERLAAYTIGYQTGKQPVANITSASNQLIFPAYAKLQDDLERFRRAYLRSLRFITTLSAPIGIGLAAASAVFVDLVYGTRWSPAAPVLAIMALMGLVLSITATMGEVLKATNRPGLFFRLSLFETICVVICVLTLYRFGIAAVAAGVAGQVTVTGLLATRSTARILRIPRAEWVRTLGPPLAAAGVMGVALAVTYAAIPAGTSAARAGLLALLAIEGTVVYVVLLRLLAPSRLDEFLRELESFAPALASRLRGLGRIGAIAARRRR